MDSLSKVRICLCIIIKFEELALIDSRSTPVPTTYLLTIPAVEFASIYTNRLNILFSVFFSISTINAPHDRFYRIIFQNQIESVLI